MNGRKLVVRWINDEQVSIFVDDMWIVTTTHDEQGWDGMQAVISTATALATAFGAQIITEGTANL